MMTEGCPKLASKAPPGLPKAEPDFNPPFNSAGFVVPSNTDHLAAAVEFAICQRLLTGTGVHPNFSSPTLWQADQV